MQYRDLTLLEGGSGQVWLVACDSVASIGEKVHDYLAVPVEMTAQSMVRVALMEVLSLRAQPQVLVYLSNNEWEPTTRQALAAMRKELAKAGYQDLSINGSCEDNMVTTMTAMGVTLLANGHQGSLLKNQVKPGDCAFLVGQPLLGQEVADGWETLPSYQDLALILSLSVHEVVPIGSKGAYQEALQVGQTNGLEFRLTSRSKVIDQSAGPATALLVVGPACLQAVLNQHFDAIWKVGDYLS